MTETVGGKILVADDDETLLHTLVWILRDRGYEVVPVPGGENLIDRLAEEQPDLLMLDIMMPKIDGLELLDRLKKDDRWHHLPVLMISSMPPEEATARSLEQGAADFIPKPFRVAELVARVEAQLKTARQYREMREAARQNEEARIKAEESAKVHAEEARTRAEMVDILREVTDSLKAEEIYHILARRVARVLSISKCSIVIAQAGDESGIVVAAFENPMLRNLQIQLKRYPEIREALKTNKPVLVSDVFTEALYEEISTRSQVASIGVRYTSDSTEGWIGPGAIGSRSRS